MIKETLAVSYERVSTDEQAKEGFSLEAQRDRNRAHIESHGWTFVRSYVDPGKSGKNLKRPDMQLLLQDLVRGDFNIVVVHKLDRLTRNIGDLNDLLKLFEKHSIKLFSITENIDTSTAMGRMFVFMLGIFAQWYRENLSEEVSKGQSTRAGNGLRNSPARPYGYNVGENLALSINEEEADVVKKMFDWYIDGWGRIKIASTLNEMGIPANRGGKWQEKIIGDILRNVTYTGAVHRKMKGAPESERIIVHGMHEPIIVMDRFELAQDIFKRRRDNDMNQSSYDFVFSTIAKCAICGRSYHGKMKTFSDKTRPHYRYYRCSGKYRPGSECTASDLVETKLSELVFQQFDTLLSKSYDHTKEVKNEHINVEKERKRLERLIGQSRDRRKNFARAMGDGKMDYEEYSELVSEEKAKVDKWESELGELPKENVVSGQTRENVRVQIENIKKYWPGMSNEVRKNSIQHLFKRIVIGKVNGEWAVLGYEFN